jgi:hypothetical protein
MTPPWIVVYATNRPFRLRCDAALRALGAQVRLASRQAELVKAIGAGTTAAVIVSDDGRDAEVAREATLGRPVPVIRHAPDESINAVVARALAVAARPVESPDTPHHG